MIKIRSNNFNFIIILLKLFWRKFNNDVTLKLIHTLIIYCFYNASINYTN